MKQDELIHLTKTEMLRHFDISRTTLGNWREKGCPVNADGTHELGATTEWRMLRDLRIQGVDGDFAEELAEAEGKRARRRYRLMKRIEEVNAWPPDMLCDPGIIKAVAIQVLILERKVLDLPEIVLKSLSSSKGEDLALPAILLWSTLEVLEDSEGDGEEGGPYEK